MMVMGISFVLFFQNCGQGFKSGVSQSPTSDESHFSIDVGGSSDLSIGGTPSLIANLGVKEFVGAQSISSEEVQGGPVEDSVLQRSAEGKALVKLTIPLPTNAVHYRAKLLSEGNSLVSNVMTVDVSDLEVRVSTKKKPAQIVVQFFDQKGLETANWTSAKFTVGDIFIAAGQSNSATHGQTSTRSSESINKAYSPITHSWVKLEDPLPMASHWKMSQFGGQNFYGGSPWPVFADLISARQGIPVGIISLGWGGSSVQEWLQGGSRTFAEYNGSDVPLLNRLVETAQSIPGCQFKAILWHQGESDSVYKTTRLQYKERMIQLRQQFIQKTGCQQPWLIARASFVPKNFNISIEQMMDIRAAQADLWQVPGFLPGPDTDLLTAANYRFDQLHFSSAGLNIHAQLWADKVQAIYNTGKTLFSEEQRITEVKNIMDLYRDILGRKDADIISDYNGLFYHSNLLQSQEVTLEQVRSNFLNSNEAFIQDKFKLYNQRAATFPEVLDLLEQLNSGKIKGRPELEQYIKNLNGCTFNNQTVANGASVPAYQSASVAFGNTCASVSQQRTCSNGTLSGTHTFASCKVTTPASVSSQLLICSDFGDSIKNSIASWYKNELQRCPEVEGLNYWYGEWKKQSLGLDQWKIAVWDINPHVKSFKACFGNTPTDLKVTACYRTGGVDLCSKGSSWTYAIKTDMCYLK